MSSMVTPKQKLIVGTQKIKRKESKQNIIESHQITKEETKKGKKEERETTKQTKHN